MTTGPTYYGVKRQSKIDHWVLPRGAQDLIETVKVLKPATRRLQIIKTRAPRDHAPLLICLKYDMAAFGKASSPAGPQQQVDRDALMMCLMKGERRHEFVNEVERRLAEERVYTAALKESTPCKCRALVSEAVRGALLKVFKKERASDER